VILHTQQKWPGDAVWAGMDIFRLAGNWKIIDWDVLPSVPTKSANSNSMF
jgi:predicted SnoaL-like aldol condensation-catalyzing enzyme